MAAVGRGSRGRSTRPLRGRCLFWTRRSRGFNAGCVTDTVSSGPSPSQQYSLPQVRGLQKLLQTKFHVSGLHDSLVDTPDMRDIIARMLRGCRACRATSLFSLLRDYLIGRPAVCCGVVSALSLSMCRCRSPKSTSTTRTTCCGHPRKDPRDDDTRLIRGKLLRWNLSFTVHTDGWTHRKTTGQLSVNSTSPHEVAFLLLTCGFVLTN